jgi:hypothetical protein
MKLNKLFESVIEGLLLEKVVDSKIVCDKCGWDWKIEDGGDDLYICHKCNNDNTPKNVLDESELLFMEDVTQENCDCCKYFDFSGDQAGAYYGGLTHPLYHELEKGIRHELKYVSPKRYMEEIARGFHMSYDDAMKSAHINWDNVKEYARKMKSGVEFPIGYYKKYGSSQEGRHRALAAMELGCESIPIVVFSDVERDEAKQIAIQYKDLPRETVDRIYKEKGYDGISDLDWRTLRSYVDYRL